MLLLYFVAMTLLLTASYGHYKTTHVVGARPAPGPASFLFDLFGGLGGTLAICALAGAGFASFDWWIPLAALVAGALVSGLIFSAIPLGTMLTLFGFPLGVVLAVLWSLLSSL